MSEIGKRVSFLKGLSEGMKISDTTNEGKLLLAILDVLEDISYELESSSEIQDDLSERLFELDDDLGCLEEEVYGEDQRHNYCDCGCDCDNDCDCDDDCDCGCDLKDHGENLKYITVECPHCKKETSFDLGVFGADTEFVECPNCHEKIEVVYQD